MCILSNEIETQNMNILLIHLSDHSVYITLLNFFFFYFFQTNDQYLIQYKENLLKITLSNINKQYIKMLNKKYDI